MDAPASGSHGAPASHTGPSGDATGRAGAKGWQRHDAAASSSARRRACLERAISINARVGWPLIIAAFALAAVVDPISFAVTDPEKLRSGILYSVYYSQGVMIFLGLFQLMLGRIVEESPREAQQLRAAQWVTALGGILYVGSGFLRTVVAAGVWVTPGASALLVVGTLMCLRVEARQHRYVVRIALLISAAGFLLDGFVQMLAAYPTAFVAMFGETDSYDQRVMRLGRAAMLAMPMLSLLYSELVPKAQREAKRFRLGQHAILLGAAALGVGLVATALVRPWIMNLALLAAFVLWIGVVFGAFFSHRGSVPLAKLGWTVLALSLTLGLGMGLYSFNSLLTIPAPPGFEQYLDIDRRYLRTGHIYFNVMSSVAIYCASDLSRDGERGVAKAWAIVAATVILEGILLAVDQLKLPTALLAIGPSAVVVALLPFLTRTMRRHRIGRSEGVRASENLRAK